MRCGCGCETKPSDMKFWTGGFLHALSDMGLVGVGYVDADADAENTE